MEKSRTEKAVCPFREDSRLRDEQIIIAIIVGVVVIIKSGVLEKVRVIRGRERQLERMSMESLGRGWRDPHLRCRLRICGPWQLGFCLHISEVGDRLILFASVWILNAVCIKIRSVWV